MNGASSALERQRAGLKTLICESPPNSITSKVSGLVLIGHGCIANSHFEVIRRLTEYCELVGVHDADPRTLQLATTATSARKSCQLCKSASGHQLRLHGAITPSGLHARQATRLRWRGTHVLTEKPMAPSWQGRMTMVKACDAAVAPRLVVKQTRSNSPLQLLKQAAVRFSKIHMSSLYVFWTRVQSYFDRTGRRSTGKYEMLGVCGTRLPKPARLLFVALDRTCVWAECTIKEDSRAAGITALGARHFDGDALSSAAGLAASVRTPGFQGGKCPTRQGSSGLGDEVAVACGYQRCRSTASRRSTGAALGGCSLLMPQSDFSRNVVTLQGRAATALAIPLLLGAAWLAKQFDGKPG